MNEDNTEKKPDSEAAQDRVQRLVRPVLNRHESHKRNAEQLAGGQCMRMSSGDTVKSGDVYSNDVYCHFVEGVGVKLNAISAQHFFRPMLPSDQHFINCRTARLSSDGKYRN